jgi:hypothetical protein
MNYQKIYESSIDHLDSIVQGYLEALSFTGASLDEEIAEELGLDYNENEPLLYDFNIYDITPNSTEKAREDCQDFLERARSLLNDGLDWELVGHDFWLTRNHHGSGFWDQDTLYGKENSEKLTEIAQEFGEKYAFVTDTGDIEIE